MKMVNNGYVSRIPQNLEGTIEELQQGGSGSGGVGSGAVYAVTATEESEWALIEANTSSPVTYEMIMDAFTEGKLVYYYQISYEDGAPDVPLMFAGYLVSSTVDTASPDDVTYYVNFMSSVGLGEDAVVSNFAYEASAPDQQLTYSNGGNDNDDNDNGGNNS